MAALRLVELHKTAAAKLATLAIAALQTNRHSHYSPCCFQFSCCFIEHFVLIGFNCQRFEAFDFECFTIALGFFITGCQCSFTFQLCFVQNSHFITLIDLNFAYFINSFD